MIIRRHNIQRPTTTNSLTRQPKHMTNLNRRPIHQLRSLNLHHPPHNMATTLQPPYTKQKFRYTAIQTRPPAMTAQHTHSRKMPPPQKLFTRPGTPALRKYSQAPPVPIDLDASVRYQHRERAPPSPFHNTTPNSDVYRGSRRQASEGSPVSVNSLNTRIHHSRLHSTLRHANTISLT